MTGQQQQTPPAVTKREIQEILRTFARSGWSSMHLEMGGMRITVGKDGPPAIPAAVAAIGVAEPRASTTGAVVVSATATGTAGRRSASPAPAVPAGGEAESAPAWAPAAPAPPPTPTVDTVGLIEVRSPAVGAFWVAPSPGSPPFVQVGQTVEQDEQLAIVEVMKLMNPVVAPQAGEVVQVCAANADMVEYDQLLFLLRPASDG